MEQHTVMLAQFDWTKLLNAAVVIRIALLIVVGFPLLAALSGLAGRATKKRFSSQSGMLLRKGIFYTGSVIIVLTILNLLEVPLATLLGAAGIVGIALGFASQTSVSNIISGLFLISERPFEVGDLVRVGDTSGIVVSIDLMSVKLRTFDNQFVRLPNENLIKTQVNNLTHYPIRRLDIRLGVAYKENIEQVETILKEIARINPHCLDEPEPVIIFDNFGDSALEFFFAVWCVKEEYLKLRQSIRQEIKERFDAEGIEIPFPHRTLYTGSVTAPLPIRLVGESVDPSAPDGN